MPTPRWEPGKLYPPGSLVIPRTDLPPASAAITNPGFESGTTFWTLGPDMATDTANPFSGANALRCTGTAGWNEAVHDPVPVSAGTSITATCMYQQGGASTNQNTGRVFLRWYDAGMNPISDSDGNLIVATEGDNYKQSTVTALSPDTVAFVAIGGKTNRTNAPDCRFDNFAWNYGAVNAPSGLVYKAVQPAIGYSDTDEPAWPITLGLTVIDNEVIWEATQANRVTWRASPIMLSGAVEPIWPTDLGAHIADNTVDWETISRRVEDVNCPNSPVTMINHGKVYMADDDIAPYCATNNPLDWTTANDAGYLPINMNPFGSTPIKAMGDYRSNGAFFNAQGFQLWQLDEDPALSSLLDALPISCQAHKTLAPAANDLLLLNDLGIRSMGIAANSTNLKAGDIGTPVDTLVLAAWKAAILAGNEPMSLYWPGSGQYWVIFKMDGQGPAFIDPDTLVRTPFVWHSQVFVYTISQLGSVGAWSRYLFPFGIDAWMMDGTTLVLRAGDEIVEMDADQVQDCVWTGSGEAPVGITPAQNFVGQVWWPWLDLGAAGVDKDLEFLDYVGEGQPPLLEIGYAQDTSNQTPGWFTDPYLLERDTVPGDFIPFECTAPSMSVRLTYNGGEAWRLLYMGLNIQGRR